MIVDLDVAKRELRRIDDNDDDRIFALIDQATALVLNHLKVPADEYALPSGVNDFPDAVAAAVLRAVVAMYYEPTVNPLTEAVKGLTHPLRDPAIA